MIFAADMLLAEIILFGIQRQGAKQPGRKVKPVKLEPSQAGSLCPLNREAVMCRQIDFKHFAPIKSSRLCAKPSFAWFRVGPHG
jgi:hypothetical protein